MSAKEQFKCNMKCCLHAINRLDASRLRFHLRGLGRAILEFVPVGWQDSSGFHYGKSL